MNLKSSQVKITLLAAVLTWAFFVPLLVNAKVFSPSAESRSVNANSVVPTNVNGERGSAPTFLPEQSLQEGLDHRVTPEMLHQMQELQSEGGNTDSNTNTNGKFTWQNGLVTGLFASLFHKVNVFAKNNYSKVLLPIAGAVAGAYTFMSGLGGRLMRKIKPLGSKIVKSVEAVGSKTIQLVKPIVKFTKDVLGPASEFIKTYTTESGAIGVIGAGVFGIATLKPVRKFFVKQISKGLQKLDNFANSFDTGSRTSLGMYGKGLAVGAGLAVVGLVAGLAMVTIEPELVQDAAGHALVRTYEVATHPKKIVTIAKETKDNFLNWSDNASMYEKGIAVSKFSINSALALDGAQAVAAKAAALKTGTIAEEATAASSKSLSPTADYISGVKVVSEGKLIETGTLDVKSTLQNFDEGIYPERTRSLFRNDRKLLPDDPLVKYTEYEKPTLGWTKKTAGPERIVSGSNGDVYYSPDHYFTFYKLR